MHDAHVWDRCLTAEEIGLLAAGVLVPGCLCCDGGE